MKVLPIGALMALLGALAPVLAGWWHPTVYFNFGPGDHPYLEGFEPYWEIDPDGLATHWASYDSAVRLPVRCEGSGGRITYRFSRIYGETARVEVRVNSVPVDRFEARGGAYVERAFDAPESLLARGPFVFALSADSHERKNRSLRMDWVAIELDDGRVAPVPATLVWSAVLSAAAAVLAWIAFPSRAALIPAASALPLAFLLYGAFAGPFPLAHLLGAIAPATLGGIAAAGLIAARSKTPHVRALAVLTVAAFLIRAGGMFHPLYYYPDLRAHADLARIVGEVGLDFWREPARHITEQGVWTAEAMGETYAFPFSPVFHAFFAPWVTDLLVAMERMKLAACLLSALELPLVFVIGARIRGPETGLWAAALSAVAPPAFSRLAFAFLAAIFAHVLDLLVLARLSRWDARGGIVFVVTLAVLLAAALGSYPGSLVNFGVLVPVLGLLLAGTRAPELRRRGIELLVAAALSAALALAVIYREFLGVFLSEILPRFLAADARAGSATPGAFLSTLAGRLGVFYGWLYLPLVGLGAFLLAGRRTSPFHWRLLAAWAASFFFLIALRAGAPDLFNKIKEMLWVAPLVALAGGEALAWVAARLRGGPVISFAYYSVLFVYGILFYVRAVAEKLDLAR